MTKDNIINVLKNEYEVAKLSGMDKSYEQALDHAIKCVEAVQGAKDVLPEIICIQCNGSGSFADIDGDEAECEYCGRVINPIKNLFAKLIMDRDEAREEIEEIHATD